MEADLVPEVVVPGGASSLDEPHPPSMFRGRADYAIDDKGRLTIPPSMRRPLRDGGVMGVLDDLAVIWDEPTFRRVVDHLDQLSARGDIERMRYRHFMSKVANILPDTQGRIVVPDPIRIQAGLEREVVVCGTGIRIEIWPAGRYEIDVELEADSSVAVALDRAGF